MTLEDETEITVSDLKTDNNGEDYITVYFETPTEDGFSSMNNGSRNYNKDESIF